jgi:hypothetical protein
MPDITFRYFRSVEGKVVPRYGTATYIGAQRDQKMGWVWDTSAVVRIPEYEVERFAREYRRALAEGAIIECARADYDAKEKSDADQTAVVVRGSNRRHKDEEK